MSPSRLFLQGTTCSEFATFSQGHLCPSRNINTILLCGHPKDKACLCVRHAYVSLPYCTVLLNLRYTPTREQRGAIGSTRTILEDEKKRKQPSKVRSNAVFGLKLVWCGLNLSKPSVEFPLRNSAFSSHRVMLIDRSIDLSLSLTGSFLHAPPHPALPATADTRVYKAQIDQPPTPQALHRFAFPFPFLALPLPPFLLPPAAGLPLFFLAGGSVSSSEAPSPSSPSPSKGTHSPSPFKVVADFSSSLMSKKQCGRM